jgi:hypothetical protein
MKPGTRTTEFWLTVVVNVAALLASVANDLPNRYAAIVAAASTGLYALSRGWAKSGGPPA